MSTDKTFEAVLRILTEEFGGQRSQAYLEYLARRILAAREKNTIES